MKFCFIVSVDAHLFLLRCLDIILKLCRMLFLWVEDHFKVSVRSFDTFES